MATDETLTKLEQGIRDLANSDRWARWLASAARFHHYSFGNQLLIALQCPDATRVAGYKTWQSMGRQVRKGERGLRILAPVVVRAKDGETADDETGKRVVGFRSVAVFDIGQTDGDDLPEITSNLTGDGPSGAWTALVAFAGDLGYSVEVMPTGEANGWCRHNDLTIAVKDTNGPAMQIKTLAHELGHALLHDGMASDGRALAELEAESVAFVVCAALGLDTGDYSFGYVTAWSRGDEAAITALRASAERIRGAAAKILNGIGASQSRELVGAE